MLTTVHHHNSILYNKLLLYITTPLIQLLEFVISEPNCICIPPLTFSKKTDYIFGSCCTSLPECHNSHKHSQTHLTNPHTAQQSIEANMTNCVFKLTIK